MPEPGQNKRPRGAWFIAAFLSLIELIKAFWKEKMVGALPVVLVLFILAVLLSFLTAISPLAPFVYPLF
jgi:hypothetical protein